MSHPTPKPTESTTGRTAESGVMLIVLIAVMIPLLTLAAAATTLMTGRNGNLLRDIHDTRAQLAAESGLAEAAHSARIGTLMPGASVTRDLGRGESFVYRSVLLSADGLDNDADGRIDEPDERALWIESTGLFGRAARRIEGVLYEPAPPPAFEAAILVMGEPDLRAVGTPVVSGFDHDLAGVPGPPSTAVDGIAAVPPHSSADLSSHYTSLGVPLITGASPSPSFGTAAVEFSLPGLTTTIRNAAPLQLTPGGYSDDIGDAAAGDYRVVYCPGDLELGGGMVGAGVLLVDGALTLTGGAHWNGLVITLGDLTLRGTSTVRGGILQGPEGELVQLAGTPQVEFSRATLGAIPSLLNPTFSVDTWREVPIR